MKKSLVSLVGVALVMSSSALAQTSIVNSKHDFSSSSTGRGTYGGGTNQTCVFCHTPHAATSDIVALWNRAFTASTFTMYSSPTLNGAIGTTPGQTSLACLSCHDGTIAISNYGGATGGTDKITTGDALIGTNLDNDHPVSLTVPASYPDADIKPRSGWSATLPLFGASADQLECPTCHEPHNRGAAGMLRVSMSQSALCTTCHNK